MLSIATGYDPRYLTGEVAKGVENYYTREVKRGEPPGVWNGGGAADLGLSGQVGDKEMQAVFVHFVDPRDPRFHGSRKGWKHAARLGRPPRKYSTVDELVSDALVREPDAEPERVEQLRRQAERQVRKAVTFIDLTFGVPKSFSILHTALHAQEVRAHEQGDAYAARQWARKAETLEQSMWAGNNAALQFLQEHAGFSRAGYHGVRSPTGGTVGRWIDAHGWIVASFLQHTNRNEDMHLHVHNAVLNRVQCTDGVWRTLDSRAIHRLRGAAGAIAERVMTEQAIARLGIDVRWSADGHTLEIVGVSAKARTVFSSRRRQVTAAVKDLADRFEQRHGRAPNALELSQLSLMASKATRPGKKHLKESTAQQLERWDQQLRVSVDQTLADIARKVPGRAPQPVADVFDPALVIALAIHQVQADRSAWTRYDLMRALNSQLPPCLGGIDAGRVVGLLNELADRALNPESRPREVICLAAPDLVSVPDELRLADGRSVFEAPAETVYATRGHLAAEESLIHALSIAAGCSIDPAAVDDALHDLASAGFELGADQTAAVRGLLTSDRQVNVLIGPAGTGKSFTLGLLAKLWEQHTGHKVIGLATGQRAALVLAEEGFTRTDNVHRWLQRQARLDFKTSNTSERDYRLEPGDLVVLDEATMTPTAELAAIWARCAAVGARLVVVGDERQLGAVGAGGAFRLMAEHADVHTLQEVRRFAQTWEAQASLLLRAGDTHAISVYERHGRLVDGGTAEHTAALAARAWLADTLAGHQSLLIVSTEEEAAEVSARLRASLVDLGKVSQYGIRLHHRGAAGTIAGQGDVIQTRRNDWTLCDPAGRAVINRDLWHVTAIASDGGLWVRRIVSHQRQDRELGLPIHLPAAYVAGHVTLGYAVTAHSAQGTTVDTCYPIVSATMSPAALYVAMTRGRLHSVAHVVTTHVADRAPENAKEVNGIRPGHLHRTAGQVLTAIMDRATPDMAAIQLQDELLIASGSLPVLGARWAEAHALAGSRCLGAVLNQLKEHHQLSAELCERVQRDEAWGSLQRLLRTAQLSGHDPHHLLGQALRERQVDSARSVAQVLHWRIGRRHGDHLIPQGDTWAQRTIVGEDPISRYAMAVAEAMDLRCGQLGEHTAANPPAWATQRLGSVPGDILARAEWIRRAGIISGYREQYRVGGDDRNPLGPCPKPGLPEARAAWFAAWRALGSPTDLAAETSMTVTELVEAVHIYNRSRQWAPDWVGDELRDAHETARTDHQTAQLAQAQAHLQPQSPHRKELLDTARQHTLSAEQNASLARDLVAIDDARAAWHAHTDPARHAARRAITELAVRNLDPFGKPEPAQPREAEREQPHPRESLMGFRGDIGSALARAAAARQRIADGETSAMMHQRGPDNEFDQQPTAHER